MKAIYLSIIFALSTFSASAMAIRQKEKTTGMSDFVRGSQEQQTAASRVVQGEKSATPVQVGGTNNTTTVVIGTNPNYRESVGINANSGFDMEQTYKESSFLKAKFPLWVSLIGLSIGGILFVIMFWLLRKSSKAFDAFYTVADTSAAKLVGRVEAIMESSNDEKTLAVLGRVKADIEKHRGIINSQ